MRINIHMYMIILSLLWILYSCGFFSKYSKKSSIKPYVQTLRVYEGGPISFNCLQVCVHSRMRLQSKFRPNWSCSFRKWKRAMSVGDSIIVFRRSITQWNQSTLECCIRWLLYFVGLLHLLTPDNKRNHETTSRQCLSCLSVIRRSFCLIS